MIEWAREHGKPVRQHSAMQQTTKKNAGTLPLSMYRKPMLIADDVDEPNDELSAESEIEPVNDDNDEPNQLSAEFEIEPSGEEEQEFEYDENDESDGEGARSDIDHGEVSEDEEEEEIVVNVPMRPVSKRIRIPNSRYSSELYVKI